MGSGIERIHAALEKENCPEVKITYNSMFTLDFPRPTYINATEKPDSSSEKTSEIIVAMMNESPNITISELANVLKKTPRAIEMQIAKLKSKGRIQRVGPDKGGHWENSPREHPERYCI